MARHHRAGLGFKHLQQQLATGTVCARCGQRLGKHRFGNDQCPNAAWRPGNGQSQWLGSTFAEPVFTLG